MVERILSRDPADAVCPEKSRLLFHESYCISPWIIVDLSIRMIGSAAPLPASISNTTLEPSIVSRFDFRVGCLAVVRSGELPW